MEKKLIELSTQLLTQPPTSAGATESLRENRKNILKGHLCSLSFLQKSRSLSELLWLFGIKLPKIPNSQNSYGFQNKGRGFGWEHSVTQMWHSKHNCLCCSSLVNILFHRLRTNDVLFENTTVSWVFSMGRGKKLSAKFNFINFFIYFQERILCGIPQSATHVSRKFQLYIILHIYVFILSLEIS